MKKYKDWQLLDTLPTGWKFDKTAGSPLNGYEFATNGKSVINGQERALVKVSKSPVVTYFDSANKTLIESKKPEHPGIVIDANYVRTVNELARAKFKQKLLNDIMVDLVICEIEGWAKDEYIQELKKLISSIGNKQCI